MINADDATSLSNIAPDIAGSNKMDMGDDRRAPDSTVESVDIGALKLVDHASRGELRLEYERYYKSCSQYAVRCAGVGGVLGPGPL